MNPEQLQLLSKYDVPVPRYTSYPTVPFWNSESLNQDVWKQAVLRTFKEENGEICLYVHLPFCEELCTYCACNKRITKNHAVETPYLETVLKEWSMYLDFLPDSPLIREIHLGGGTPTFFSPENLKLLIEGLKQKCRIAENFEFSVEVHPNYTNTEHLKALYEVGFRRISMGVQDFDPAVQFIINRIQTPEQTKRVIDTARNLGYTSVNIDLIYGLPKQTAESIRHTIGIVKELMPDRIAFYSYAHVPWKSKGQRRYSDEDVPGAEAKTAMYGLGSSLLEDMGFISIGMDHFALPQDQLMKAHSAGRLHRNFMGYTTSSHKLLIGLGASSISDTWFAFAQNEKTVEDYQTRVHQGELPLCNGHLLSGDDLLLRRHILNLMCRGTTRIQDDNTPGFLKNRIMETLSLFEQDGLIQLNDGHVRILPKGNLFIRNISSAFDAYLYENREGKPIFSKSI